VNDLIIVGAGVAGMTASVYASRYKINHLIFGEIPGGQGTLAGKVENYPGYVSINGPELMEKFVEQVKNYGVEIKQEKVGGLAKIEGGFEVTTKEKFQAKTLILAMGASYRHLNIPGEDKFVGKGVSYCTEPTWIEKMKQAGNVEEVLSNEVKEIKGIEKVESIVLKNPYQGSSELKVDGVFIEVGQVPSSALAGQLGVELDERNYVKVNPGMATNVPGVFAAGDLAAIQGGILFRQFVTAASDGARAAASVYQHLHKGTAPAPSWSK
jgi:thioredoxin reductase